MAVSEEEREAMIHGLVGLRRVRLLLPGNEDVDRGISGIKAALGEAVSQRTAAKAIGITHPELSKLISAKELAIKDTARGRSQVEVESLVAYIEGADLSPPEPPAWKRRRAEREAAAADPDLADQQADLQRIMKMRALAFHRALARNLDRELVERAQEIVADWRESGELSAEQAEAWEVLLARPVTDIAAKMTDYSPAGEALREKSPFQRLGRRASDPT